MPYELNQALALNPRSLGPSILLVTWPCNEYTGGNWRNLFEEVSVGDVVLVSSRLMFVAHLPILPYLVEV